jgi:hypothetical protein
MDFTAVRNLTLNYSTASGLTLLLAWTLQGLLIHLFDCYFPIICCVPPLELLQKLGRVPSIKALMGSLGWTDKSHVH